MFNEDIYQPLCFVSIIPHFFWIYHQFGLAETGYMSHPRGELDHEKIFQAIQKAKKRSLRDGIYVYLLELYRH